MNLHPRGGGPSQRSPYVARPSSVPMADLGVAGYSQGYPAAPNPGGPEGSPGSWVGSGNMEYRQRISMGEPAVGASGAPGAPYTSGPPQGGVWSSPFGFTGSSPVEGATADAGAPVGAPSKGTTPEQQIMNMVLHSVADNLTSQAEKHVSLLQQRFPSFLLSLRPYFSVSQGYVFMRLCQLLFPFRSLFCGSPSSRGAAVAASDISNTTAVASSPERDMYIPLMSLTTFVLLVCIQTGTQGGFYPELLGSTLSLSLLLLLGEVGALKLVLYITGASAAAAADLLCFCGYKYVHVALLLLLRLSMDLFGGPPLVSAGPRLDSGIAPEGVEAAAAAGEKRPLLFICCFVYLSCCAAAELFVLLKRADAAGKDASTAYLQGGPLRGPCASYVIAVAAAMQIPLCWFLLPCKVFST